MVENKSSQLRMLSSTQTILQLYQQVIQGQSTESIKEAELQLRQQEATPSFIEDNSAILSSEDVPFPVKQLAATYIKAFTKRLTEASLEKCSRVLEQVYSLVKNPALQMKIKSLLISPIEILLKEEASRGFRKQQDESYIKLISGAATQQDSEIDFTFIAIYGTAYLTKDLSSKEAIEIMRETIEPMMGLVLRFNQHALSHKAEDRQAMLKMLNIMKQFCHLLKLYFTSLSKFPLAALKQLNFSLLEKLLTSVLHANPPNNATNTTIYAYLPSDEEVSSLLNKIRALYIEMLSATMKAILKHRKQLDIKTLGLSEIPELITELITSTSEVLRQQPYYSLINRANLLSILHEVLYLLIDISELDFFADLFISNRMNLIEKIIVPCLALTPQDVDNFYENGEEFANTLLHTSRREIRTVRHFYWIQNTEDELNHSISSLSAQLLYHLCERQAEVLTYIIDTAIDVLRSKIQKHMPEMHLLLCILAPLYEENKDIQKKIASYFRTCRLRVVKLERENPENIEFALILLSLSQIFPVFYEMYHNYDDMCQLGVKILLDPSTNTAHQILVLEFFDEIARNNTEEDHFFDETLLLVYNQILKRSERPFLHLLTKYLQVFETMRSMDEMGEQYSKKLKESSITQFCMRLMSQLIYREMKKIEPDKDRLAKYWQILRSISENEVNVPSLLNHFEAYTVPLLPMICDGRKNDEYEQEIIKLLTTFIKERQEISENIQKLFEVVPLFFNQKGESFEGLFEVMQLYIHHSEQENEEMISTVVKMGISEICHPRKYDPPKEYQYGCDGALVLQSLINRHFDNIELGQWDCIISTALRRLEEEGVRCPLAAGNLWALLCLTLAYSHPLFQDEENDELLTKLLEAADSLKDVLSAAKVMIAGLEMLLEHPETKFIGARYPQILKVFLALLENYRKKYFSHFQKNQKYDATLRLVRNQIKEKYIFTYLQEKIGAIKPSNKLVLKKHLAQLPEERQLLFYEMVFNRKGDDAQAIGNEIFQSNKSKAAAGKKGREVKKEMREEDSINFKKKENNKIYTSFDQEQVQGSEDDEEEEEEEEEDENENEKKEFSADEEGYYKYMIEAYLDNFQKIENKAKEGDPESIELYQKMKQELESVFAGAQAEAQMALEAQSKNKK